MRGSFIVSLPLVVVAFLFAYAGSANSAAPLDACAATAVSEPLSAGLSRIRISSPCRAKQKVRFRYDALELARALDVNGRLEFTFDCFLGDKLPFSAAFEDGTVINLPLRTVDLDRVTKVAIIWNGAVNLDLHALEYASDMEGEGHVWAGAPASRWQVEERMRAEKRGHGFLSSMSDGSTEGDQLEVYTFVHEPGQKAGAVTLALDYESRARLPQDPDTCGTGLYADIEYKVTVWHPSGRISRSQGAFSPMECNRMPDQRARYSSKAMPQLLLTR